MNDPRGESLPGALQGLGVLYFGNDWYGENRTSSHHVARRLAGRMPVLYVDSPGMRAPGASGRDFKRAFAKLAASLRSPRRLDARLWHCTVPQLPFRRIPGVAAFNRAFGRWAVRRAARLAGIGPRLSWFVVPHPGFLAGQLDEELCVYYCIDDYAAHPGVDAAAIERCDRELSRRADLLFVAPPALLEAKRAQNANVIAAPHGVDAELFAAASAPSTTIPAAAAALPRPIVGFFGSLHEWIDVPLLEWLARQRPGWTFLLVGHAHVPLAGLRKLPNVHLAGAQPYPDLPRWAKAFDVAIIPYRLNRQVANANPLKLREYLATGKPVVSVRNQEIEKFGRWVRIADGRDAFLAALDAAIREPDGDGAQARMAAVADQGWDRRVEDVLDAVAARLGSLRAPAPGNATP
jgi:glycosyltransferase involved in cell wall biosynthesis